MTQTNPMTNHTILITGASRGIGAATAYEFATESAYTILASCRLRRILSSHR